LVRALTSSEIVVSSTQSVGEIIRLRDVWDASLKKMLDMIQK
jgi:glutamyl-tRNA reductase